MGFNLHKCAIGALASGLLLAAPAALFAHHSTAAYDSGKILTLKGVVTEVKWVNPHSYVIMDVSDGNGGENRWSVLSGTPTLNVRNGWKYDDVKVGDTITVTVHPARDAKVYAGILRRVTLADGRSIAGPREFLTVPKEGQPPSP